MLKLGRIVSALRVMNHFVRLTADSVGGADFADFY